MCSVINGLRGVWTTQNYPDGPGKVLGFVDWRLLQLLQWDHIYTADYFLALMALLAASLAACTSTRQWPMVRVARRCVPALPPICCQTSREAAHDRTSACTAGQPATHMPCVSRCSGRVSGVCCWVCQCARRGSANCASIALHTAYLKRHRLELAGVLWRVQHVNFPC